MDLFTKDWNELVSNCTVPVSMNGVDSQVATLRCIPAVFKNVVSAALIFAGIVALFFIIFAGIKFITSGGDAKQVEGARKTLTFAIIGLIVVLLAFFIVHTIGFLTGTTDCITKFGFDQCQ
jgi:hypothetical protein